MPTRPRCSIVIRCFNEEKHIGRLLAGIEQQTVRDRETIVVDSGSTDATVAIASHYPIELVTIRPEEFSFGRALNMGCERATGEFIVAASAHVYPVRTDWLERLLTPFEDKRTALSFGRQRGNEQTKFSEHRVFQKWFPEQSNSNQTTPFCNNANAAVRREIWEELSYDETLTGLEDIDWAKKAMARGYRIAYAADAPIIHVHEETPSNIYNRYRREAIALRRISPEEKLGLLDFLRLFPANVVSDWYHALDEGVLLKNTGGILVFRLMQFWGTYRGWARRAPLTGRLKHTFYYPNALTPGAQSAEDNAKQIDYGQLYGGSRVDGQDR